MMMDPVLHMKCISKCAYRVYAHCLPCPVLSPRLVGSANESNRVSVGCVSSCCPPSWSGFLLPCLPISLLFLLPPPGDLVASPRSAPFPCPCSDYRADPADRLGFGPVDRASLTWRWCRDLWRWRGGVRGGGERGERRKRGKGGGRGG